jgi:hypothetical protein
MKERDYERRGRKIDTFLQPILDHKFGQYYATHLVSE